MRPIERGPSPRATDFDDYRDAFPELASRLGSYCSFCERRIPANLAVEHIQPKALLAYAALVGRWDNFLLACVNCNSTKGDRDVVLADVVLPDRDNSDKAFVYAADGSIAGTPTFSPPLRAKANATLALCGLDKAASRVRDANGRFVAIDRSRQRQDAWAIAEDAKASLATARTPVVIQLIVNLALAQGFFSVWMTVFASDLDVRRALIAAFPGTATTCYDPSTTLPVSPRPAPVLPGGGKC
jgi:uncharacterized protein (TIGR02646 family)